LLKNIFERASSDRLSDFYVAELYYRSH